MSLSSNLIEKSSYIFKGKSSWSIGSKIYQFSSPSVTVHPLFYSSNFAVPTEVQKLIQELAHEENICMVRAVAPNAPDLHIIDFELEVKPETELSAEAWDKIRDLVIDSEWKLRDDTNEKWYFFVEVVEVFPQVKAGAEVVADSQVKAGFDFVVERHISHLKSIKTTSSAMKFGQIVTSQA